MMLLFAFWLWGIRSRRRIVGALQEAAAERLGVPFLGRIPLDIAIRTASDAGTPPAAGNGVEGAAFAEVAGQVAAWLETQKG